VRTMLGTGGRGAPAWGRPRGFTLVELMVALAVSAMIVVGAAWIMRSVVLVTAENRYDTIATVNVQVVGFWINDDVVQAQEIKLGGVGGFPLTIEWTEWNGDRNRVTYSVEFMTDALGNDDLYRLSREHEKNTGSGYESMGSVYVGEHLVSGTTRCYWSEDSEDVLVLDVTARFDRSEASSKYEMHPRALNRGV